MSSSSLNAPDASALRMAGKRPSGRTAASIVPYCGITCSLAAPAMRSAISVPDALGPHGESVAPVVDGRVDGGWRADAGVEHEGEQVVLGRHVAIERHGSYTELLGHSAHGQRAQTVGHRHLDARRDQPVECQAAPRSSGRAVAETPGQLDARRQRKPRSLGSLPSVIRRRAPDSRLTQS
jgi:hypothetical protein